MQYLYRACSKENIMRYHNESIITHLFSGVSCMKNVNGFPSIYKIYWSKIINRHIIAKGPIKNSITWRPDTKYYQHTPNIWQLKDG